MNKLRVANCCIHNYMNSHVHFDGNNFGIFTLFTQEHVAYFKGIHAITNAEVKIIQ